MGMFDTVRITCPHCGKTHHEQTKSGPCVLDEVDLTDADPTMISGLADSRGLIWCHHCNQPMTIAVRQRPIYEALAADINAMSGDD